MWFFFSFKEENMQQTTTTNHLIQILKISLPRVKEKKQKIPTDAEEMRQMVTLTEENICAEQT